MFYNVGTLPLRVMLREQMRGEKVAKCWPKEKSHGTRRSTTVTLIPSNVTIELELELNNVKYLTLFFMTIFIGEYTTQSLFVNFLV